MSEEKLHTDEYDVIDTNGKVENSNDPNKGNFNKIKLKIVSRAVMMEVQEAYMKEEIELKEKQKEEIENKVTVKEASKEIADLDGEITILHDTYIQFSESRKRFMEEAKKILAIPEVNFKELKEHGKMNLNGEVVTLEKVEDPAQDYYEETQNILSDVQEDSVFSNLDTDLIKQEVERAMNDKLDNVESKVTSDNLDENVKELAKDVKDSVDQIKEDEIKVDNVDDIINQAKELTTEKDENDLLMQTIPFDGVVEGTWVGEDEKNDIFEQSSSTTVNEQGDTIMDLDSFDFTNEADFKELEQQIEELAGLCASSKEVLTAKDEKKSQLATEKLKKEREAQEKYAKATEIVEKRRAEAREKALAEKRAELERLRSQLLSTNEQIKAAEESINTMNSEIAGYQASIDKSDKIINSDEEKISVGRIR